MLRSFHAAVAILLLLAGGALIGLGIWLQTSRSASPFQIAQAEDSVNYALDVLVNSGIAAITAGCFLMLAGIFSLISLGRKCIGITFRVIYIIMAIIITLILLAICVLSSIIVAKRDNANIRDNFQAGWTAATVSYPQDICAVEEKLQCRGYFTTSCRQCPTGNEPQCQSSRECIKCQNNTLLESPQGCYGTAVKVIHDVFLPVAIVSAVLTCIQFADSVISCAL